MNVTDYNELNYILPYIIRYELWSNKEIIEKGEYVDSNIQIISEFSFKTEEGWRAEKIFLHNSEIYSENIDKNISYFVRDTLNIITEKVERYNISEIKLLSLTII